MINWSCTGNETQFTATDLTDDCVTADDVIKPWDSPDFMKECGRGVNEVEDHSK